MKVSLFRPSKSQKKVAKKISNKYRIYRSYQQNGYEEDGRPILSIKVVSINELTHLKEEIFSLFVKYQSIVHKDIHMWTYESFETFIFESALEQDLTRFILFSIDSKIVGVSTIDILPDYISSCYFFYSPEHSNLSLGIFSAMIEIELAFVLEKQYYTLGKKR